MKPEEFKLDRFNRGAKYALELDLGPAARGVRLPVLLVRGGGEGKVLVAMAGVHGDEFEGVRAILEVYSILDPKEMKGDFLSVPVANPPAFWNGTRTSPLDEADLARAFPGDLALGPTSATAHFLANSIIKYADLFLDLHSGGVKLLMPSMVGYDANDRRSREAALAFGARILWAHPNLAAGRTISFAAACGIPWLYTEAKGAGRIDPADLELFTEGCKNLLRHLAILPGTPPVPHIDCCLCGEGDTDHSVKSSSSGFFIPNVGLLEKVSSGQPLGRLVNLHGETIETFLAPCAGVVALIRQFPVVEPGMPMFLVTGVLRDGGTEI